MIRGRMIQTLPPVSASEVMPVPCWNGIESGFPGAFDEHDGPALRRLPVLRGEMETVQGMSGRIAVLPPILNYQFSILNPQCAMTAPALVPGMHRVSADWELSIENRLLEMSV